MFRGQILAESVRPDLAGAADVEGEAEDQASQPLGVRHLVCARFVTPFASRSATSGGAAHSGNSNNYGETVSSSTRNATIRATLATLLEQLPRAGSWVPSIRLEALDLGEIVRAFQVFHAVHATNEIDQFASVVHRDVIGQHHRLGRTDRAEHPAREMSPPTRAAPHTTRAPECSSAPSTSNRYPSG